MTPKIFEEIPTAADATKQGHRLPLLSSAGTEEGALRSDEEIQNNVTLIISLSNKLLKK